MVRIKFFRTLAVTQRLATIWGVFVKEKEEEKQLNLSKRNEFCVFTKKNFFNFLATPLSSSLVPQFPSSLTRNHTHSPCI